MRGPEGILFPETRHIDLTISHQAPAKPSPSKSNQRIAPALDELATSSYDLIINHGNGFPGYTDSSPGRHLSIDIAVSSLTRRIGTPHAQYVPPLSDDARVCDRVDREHLDRGQRARTGRFDGAFLLFPCADALPWSGRQKIAGCFVRFVTESMAFVAGRA